MLSGRTRKEAWRTDWMRGSGSAATGGNFSGLSLFSCYRAIFTVVLVLVGVNIDSEMVPGFQYGYGMY